MSAPAGHPARVFSCTRCFDRKVKCDRQTPCSNCLRSSSDCVFRVPPAPRRKKKEQQPHEHSGTLIAYLKDYEHLLQSPGPRLETPSGPIRFTSVDSVNQNTSPDLHGPSISAETERATEAFMPPSGRLRFVENNLWRGLSEEVGMLIASARYV